MNFLLLFLLASLASGIEREREPVLREVPKRTCDQGAIQRCRTANQSAADECRSKAAALGLQMEPKGVYLNAEKTAFAATQEKIQLLEMERMAHQKEIVFLESAEKLEQTILLEGFPSAEDLFSLKPLERSWFERGSRKRREILELRSAQILRSETDLQSRARELNEHFQILFSEYSAISTQKSDLDRRTLYHDGMVQSGCREEICNAD